MLKMAHLEHFPLNMTNEEKNVYEMLLAFGQLTAGEMSQYNHITLDSASALLESLLQKGFATKISNFGNHYLAKFPFLETHTHFKELNDQINALNTQSKNFFEDRKKDLANYQENKNSEISQDVSVRINDFNQHSSDLKQKIDNTISEFDSELKTLEENFISNINSQTQQFKETEKGKIKLKISDHDKTIQENQVKILSTVHGHKAELETLSNNFTSNIKDFSLSYLDEVYDRLRTLLNDLREDLNNLSATFDNDGKDWTKKSLDTQMNVFNDFKAVLDDNFAKFGDLLANEDQLLNQMTIDSELPNSQNHNQLLKFIVLVNNNFIDLKNQLSNKLQEAKVNYMSELEKVTKDVAGFKKTTQDSISSITSLYLEHLNQNTDNYKNTVSTTITTNKSDIQSFTTKLNSEFQDLEKIRKDSMLQIAEDMRKQQEFALQTQKQANSQLQDGILAPFNTQYAEINRLKNKFFSDTTKAVDNHYKAIDAKMKDIITSFKTSYDGFTEKTQGKADEAMKVANKELDAFIKSEQQLITSHMSDLKKPIPNMQTNADKQIADIESKLDVGLQVLDSAVDTHFKNTQNALDSIQKLFITDLTADIQNLINTTNDEDSKVTKLDLLKKIKENLTKKQQSAEKEIKNSNTELTTKILDPFKKQLADLNTRKTALKDFLTKSSSDYFTSVNKHLDDLDTSLKTKTDSLNTKILKSIESSFTKLKGDYKNFIKEQYKITDDYFKEEQKNLPVHKKDGIKLIKDINKLFSPELKRLDTTVKTFTTSASNLMNSLDAVIINGIPDNLRTNIARTSEELAKNSSEAQNQLLNYKNSYLESIIAMESTLQSFNDINKTQHTNEITNMKNESLKVLEEETNSVSSFNSYIYEYGNKNVETEHQKFQDLLTNSLNTSKNGLLDMIHEQQAELNATIDKKKTDFEKQNAIIQEKFSTISSTLDEYISNFNNTTQERANSRETETTDLHNETKNKITTETKDINTKHLSEIGTTITKHETDYKDHHSNLQTMAHEFLQLVENDSKSFADGVRDDATIRMQQNKSLLLEKTNYVRSVHNSYAFSVATANETATKLQNGLINSVGEHYNKLISGNEGFTGDFQTTVKKGLEILTPKITIMEDFERIVNEFNYPKITSLPIIGSGSALHTINYYLSDFKASVTLLIPNPNDIPVEMISKTKRPKRVTVASMFNLDNQREKEMVNKLIQQDNVTVRQLTPSHGTEDEYAQYLSADRDSEEILFGAYDKDNKAEFAGMVSQNRKYIEFIGRVITSDFLSKARKIEKV